MVWNKQKYAELCYIMLPLTEGKRENNAIQYLYLMYLAFLYTQKKMSGN